MRGSYLIALCITLIGAGVYWYQATAYQCPVPLSYKLGTIDPSFNITPEEAKWQAAAAEAVWESTVGRELFTYDEQAAFTIDFVFDERQETANAEVAERVTLDAKRAESESVQQTVEMMQREHEQLARAYEAEVAAYEAHLAEYNAEVTKYNDRGGAPPEVYETLEAERAALESESDKLNSTAAQLNDLAAEINRLGARANQLVEAYNREVDQYNAAYGLEREFTQGDYQGDSIHIYKFSNDAELVTVLAHEFGHALGIDHVEGEASLMYYLLAEDLSEAPTLSGEDVEAFVAMCGTEATAMQKVRHQIRQLLQRINL